MSKLIIEEYAEKVDPPAEGAAWGVVRRGDYERTHVCSYPNAGGWASRRDFSRHAREIGGTPDPDRAGAFRYDKGRAWGIHSYQVVFIED